MKHLIIYAHFNNKSFTRGIVDKISDLLNSQNKEHQIIDLYGDKFNPVLGMDEMQLIHEKGEVSEDVLKYQEKISWADHITFVYPIWWAQMPAILKGFIDRVFTFGFAYKYGKEGVEGMLGNKTAKLIVNTGATNDVYQKTGIADAHKKLNIDGILNFCGIDADVTYFGNIINSTDEERKNYLDSLTEMYK